MNNISEDKIIKYKKLINQKLWASLSEREILELIGKIDDIWNLLFQKYKNKKLWKQQ